MRVPKDKQQPFIPLPNELPPQIMPEVIEQEDPSQAVEMAVTQNTDLMNRLSLALKRSANLEARLKFVERDNQHKKEKLSVLDDELQVLRTSQGQAHIQTKEVFRQITDSKKKYDLLYQKYVQKETLLEQAQKRIRLLERFKQRVITYVKKDIQNLKTQSIEDQNQIQALQSQTFEQQNQMTNAQKQLETLKTQSVQAQTQYYTDLASLVDYHEKRYLGLQKLSKTLDKQNKSQGQKIEDLQVQKSKVQQQLTKAKNQIALLEEKLCSQEKESQTTLQKTLDSLNACQQDLQEKNLQIVRLQAKEAQLKTIQSDLEERQGERDRLQIRLQSKDLEYQEVKQALLESEKNKQKMVAQNSLLRDQVEGFKHLIEDNLENADKTKSEVKSSTDQQIEVIEQILKS